MNWSVEQCIEKFQSMCRTAFTRRLGGAIPGVRVLVDNYNHSKYETKPLEGTLKAAFTENDYLFGGSKRQSYSRIKVAVTATSLTGRVAIVFGNYNRLSAEKRKKLLPASKIQTDVDSSLPVPAVGAERIGD
jgi:hypothetical protein